MWVCLECYEVGYYNYEITGQHLLKGNFFGLRDLTILTYLSKAISLAPLNLLIYTCRFYEIIIKEAENKTL